MLMLLIVYPLWKLNSASAVDGEVDIAGLSFQINGDLNADGAIRLKEITSYSADLLHFRKLPKHYDGARILAKAVHYYNAKLKKYCIAEASVTCEPSYPE